MALLALEQAAAELNCSERWLADNLRAGRFPGKKIARKWMLDGDDIAAILQICSVKCASALCVDSSGHSLASSMTKTTRRRIQQSGRRQ